MLKTIILLLVLLIISPGGQADAEPVTLHIPIDCQTGTTCFIQNYTDADPSTDYHDYTCGFLSYNDHKGTDFRLPNLDMMHAGVRVLAAAPGIVRAIRDGMPDINIKKIDRSVIKDREAGNSVVIRHENGWETQYSHLRQGSVLVKAGDPVQTGQPLGLVGLSGNTEFPHLDFAVRHEGKVIDPFTGNNIDAGCGHAVANSLWDKSIAAQLEYQSSGILEAGFTDHIPDIKPYHEYIKNKQPLPDNTDNIIFWAHVFGVQKNDVQQLTIVSPDGKIIAEKKVVIERNEARRLAILVAGTTGKRWPAGAYTGKYVLRRKADQVIKNIIEKTFSLEMIARTGGP